MPAVSPRPPLSAFGLAGACVVGIVGAAVVAFTQVPADARDALLAPLLYTTMWGVLLAFVLAAIVRLRHARLGTWLRAHGLGLALAAATTTAIAFAVPPRMRVQFDETSLLGQSFAMHERHLAVMATGAVPYRGEHVPVESTVDKRPPAFPFVCSLLHAVTGARVENAFALNLALLALAQVLVFAAVRARFGVIAAVAGVLLLLSVPVVPITATSAGFELLALVLFGAATLAARDVVVWPDAGRCAWFAATGVAFAATRYEALPALALLAVVVAVRGRRRVTSDVDTAPAIRTGTLVAIAVGAGVLLAPLAMLLVHGQQTKFYPEAGGRPLLAFAHFVEHVVPFVAQWCAPSLANPLPGLVGGLALLALPLLLRRERRPSFGDLVLWTGPVLAVTVLTLAWFFGDVREVIAVRLFLPIAVLTAFAPLGLVARWGRPAALALCAIGVVLVPLRTAAVADGRAAPPANAARLCEELDALVAQLALDPQRTLWVGAPAQYLILRGHAALSPRAFAQRAGDVQSLRAQGDVRTIVVVTTPMDAAMAGGLGDAADVLARCPHTRLAQREGTAPLAVYRID